MAEPEWISAAEAARRLGVKQATLYSYVSRGVLTRRRAGRPRRWRQRRRRSWRRAGGPC